MIYLYRRSSSSFDGGWCVWKHVHTKRFFGMLLSRSLSSPVYWFVSERLSLTFGEKSIALHWLSMLTFICRTILRNETLYPNPDVFYPDRFTEKVDEQTERRRDPRNYVFGFGRRYLSNLNAHSCQWNIQCSLDIVLGRILSSHRCGCSWLQCLQLSTCQNPLTSMDTLLNPMSSSMIRCFGM